ncbi:MAG: hypothetical protein ACLFNI_04935 [Natronomonas sp.]
MVALQLFGINPLGDQILGMVLIMLVIALGIYIGVLMALQTFFDSSTWEDSPKSNTE